jgi:hypothetical protein
MSEKRQFTIHLKQTETGEEETILCRQGKAPDVVVFKADPDTLDFDYSGGSKSSTVTSTINGAATGWTVSNKTDLPSWITLSGEGTGTLTITTTSNN